MSTPSLRTRRDALSEGARVLDAMAAVYAEETRPGPWARRAQEARRYARALREMARRTKRRKAA